eukprot:CAMPEP_0114992524 /NCGR_PEP_ID=MMETSP0216-20121206/11990_1 /TAXON_ID=223996 /ORGANISM="Protocruzia adherens, Strain Boccale" /LENGTH=65 /DNA_ID=CAMNT_0002356001 /DNA_START=1199 /DNA_END=1396 /DNA_ORIENTATION=-
MTEKMLIDAMDKVRYAHYKRDYLENDFIGEQALYKVIPDVSSSRMQVKVAKYSKMSTDKKITTEM